MLHTSCTAPGTADSGRLDYWPAVDHARLQAMPRSQCRYIFRMKDLDLGRLATALGLLRLPRMPELRGGVGTAAFVPSAVDPGTVKVGVQ